MKNIFILLSLFIAINLNAQNYLISFAGTGGSSSVGTVKVENLTSGTSVTINGGDVLRLTSPTGINMVRSDEPSDISIYPNPMTEYSNVQFSPETDGDVTVSVLDITGKVLASSKHHLENFIQEFRLSGLDKGLYLISVKGSTFQYAEKLLSEGGGSGKIRIERISNNQISEIKTGKNDSKGTRATVDMAYTAGDRLKFTGISGNYSTVMTDIPSSNKTFTFNFTACSDGDNISYSTVTIGTQTWMAENLRTTKYNDGNIIPLVTDVSAWQNLTTPAYCWYNNDEATYKATYGALYNKYTVNTGNLCPTGWHAPTYAEWTTLENFLYDNGYSFNAPTSNNQIAKAMASTTLWASDTHTGSVGNTDYPAKRNATGFTAFPGGWRGTNGSYQQIGTSTYWWEGDQSSSDGYRYLSNIFTVLTRNYYLNKKWGHSVRCIKD